MLFQNDSCSLLAESNSKSLKTRKTKKPKNPKKPENQVPLPMISKLFLQFLLFIATFLACHCTIRACHPCVIQSVGAASILDNLPEIVDINYFDMQADSSYLSQYSF